MSNSTDKKREEKQEIVNLMIRLYCKGNKHQCEAGALCPSCKELLRYTQQRTAQCKFIEESLFCQSCKAPCYSQQNREKIAEVMRYAGPRMLFRKPLWALRHLQALRRG